jgi:hypothetical protein
MGWSTGVCGFEESRAWIGRDDSLGVLGWYELCEDKLPVEDCSVRRDGGRDQNLDDMDPCCEALDCEWFETRLGMPSSGDSDTGTTMERGSPGFVMGGRPKIGVSSERCPSRTASSIPEYRRRPSEVAFERPLALPGAVVSSGVKDLGD